MITAVALLTVVYVRWRPPPEESLAVADAFGLAFFVVSGAGIAQDMGLPVISARNAAAGIRRCRVEQSTS